MALKGTLGYLQSVRISLGLILCLSLGQKVLFADCKNQIIRVKNAPPHLRGRIIEFRIDQITYIHEVPNPKREDHSPNFLDELMELIKKEGFQECYAVPLVRMPDGTIYCAGHHRTEAMKRLGEESIPAYIYDWDDLSPAQQDRARIEFPELFTRRVEQLAF